MSTSVDISEVVRKLDNIDSAMRGKLGRRACREGAKVFAAIARGQAKSPIVRQSIKVRSMRRSRTRVGVNVVISSDDFPKGAFDSFDEFGHQMRPSRNGKPGKTVPASHWEAAALRRSRNVILEAVADEIREGLPGAANDGGGE